MNQGLKDNQDYVKPWMRGLCFFWLGGHIPQGHFVDCTMVRGVWQQAGVCGPRCVFFSFNRVFDR